MKKNNYLKPYVKAIEINIACMLGDQSGDNPGSDAKASKPFENNSIFEVTED